MTFEEYQELAKNGCNICGSYDGLCVDHDHKCCAGKKSCGECVRGILCRRHNLAEGFLNSDPDEAIALAFYILNSRIRSEQLS